MNKEIKLFSYQKKALECIRADKSHSQLISMPTGTGKTITFLSAIKEINKTCIVLVHREELLEQTYDKAQLCGFKEEEISVIKSGKKEEFKKLNIAMVQTLARNLEMYDKNSIEMMVIDEAHHALAPSYTEVIKYFEIFEKEKILLGFTATPLRADKKLLSSIFLSHSFKITIQEATQNGYICPVYGLRIEIQKSLEDIDQVNGDYDISKLDKVMNCDEINDLVAEKCQFLSKTPCIIFCTSVDHAQKISKKLRERKRRAISISYKNSKKTIETILKMLKEKRVDFITNAVKLSEGFDHPAIQTIIIARPTRSPVLYKQIIGRGLRNHPDKSECTVIEFCGNDPKTICWEDIDENCSFHCINSEMKKSRDEAIDFYKSRMEGDKIKILDVRISPFSFYECCIRRSFKVSKFIYCYPFTEGFSIYELRRDNMKYTRSRGVQDGNYYYVFASMFFWKDKYKSFYLWNEGDYRMNPYPDTIPRIERFSMEKYVMANDLKKWYPSEEENISHTQINYMKKLGMDTKIKTNSRKCEMLIEEKAVKIAVQKYMDPWRVSGVMSVYD